MSMYKVFTWQDETGSAPTHWNWYASFGQYDLGAIIGHGATEQEAIADLVTNHDLPGEGA